MNQFSPDGHIGGFFYLIVHKIKLFFIQVDG